MLEALVQYRFHGMTCSIDGASNETYQQYRVRGDFDRVIANIETINRHKKKYHSPYPYLKWQFVVFGHNEHEIEAARRKAAELDMEFYTKLSWDESISPVRDAERVRKATGQPSVSRSEHEKESGTDYMNHVCNQLWDLPQINWNGDVLGCCINHWGRFGGNAFEDGLDAVVNSPAMRDARAMLTGRGPERTDIPCSTCFVYRKMKNSGKWMQRPTDTDARRIAAAKPQSPADAMPAQESVNG
ncbi:MAG: SPASM domain-containing protein [Rhodospirillaceae bacterium]|nr:SPASM domain-containing protein [Rhodospirillaceae bacterium]